MFHYAPAAGISLVTQAVSQLASLVRFTSKPAQSGFEPAGCSKLTVSVHLVTIFSKSLARSSNPDGRNFGHYMTSIPFGYIFLSVKSTSKAFRILPLGALAK